MMEHKVEKHSTPSHIDPVCGMTVKPDGEHHFEYQGMEYRFCSAGCKHKLIAASQPRPCATKRAAAGHAVHLPDGS
jgi:YHS domain-containing protein